MTLGQNWQAEIDVVLPHDYCPSTKTAIKQDDAIQALALLRFSVLHADIACGFWIGQALLE